MPLLLQPSLVVLTNVGSTNDTTRLRIISIAGNLVYKMLTLVWTVNPSEVVSSPLNCGRSLGTKQCFMLREVFAAALV